MTHPGQPSWRQQIREALRYAAFFITVVGSVYVGTALIPFVWAYKKLRGDKW